MITPNKTMNAWNVKVLTLFPDMFPGPLGQSIAGRAMDKGLWSCEAINIRDYSLDKHKNVDDTPAGGGAGMVMRADILGAAIEDNSNNNTKLVYMSPRGKKLTQNLVYELTECNDVVIICGRFEGVDERVLEEYEIEEISVGDYILSGGEIAAFALMDSCVRVIPGVLGNKDTLNEESFGNNEDYAGLLEYPLYTRPVEWKGRKIPEVLFSGHHVEIDKWRLERSIEVTKERRKDLWEKYKNKK